MTMFNLSANDTRSITFIWSPNTGIINLKSNVASYTNRMFPRYIQLKQDITYDPYRTDKIICINGMIPIHFLLKLIFVWP